MTRARSGLLSALRLNGAVPILPAAGSTSIRWQVLFMASQQKKTGVLLWFHICEREDEDGTTKLRRARPVPAGGGERRTLKCRRVAVEIKSWPGMTRA